MGSICAEAAERQAIGGPGRAVETSTVQRLTGRCATSSGWRASEGWNVMRVQEPPGGAGTGAAAALRSAEVNGGWGGLVSLVESAQGGSSVC